MAAFLAPALSQGQDINHVLGKSPRKSRLVLLGTKGGPTPSRFRAPASSLLVVGEDAYVIDCPDGVAGRLVQAGVDLAKLQNIFISHHHSDHVAGLGALLVLAWGSDLQTPLTVHGPPPLKRVLDAQIAANAYDIEVRIREEGRPPLAPLISGRTLSRPGMILETPNVQVHCAFGDHYTVPSIAFRFDTPDRSIVFSGDTRPSENLIELAKGADVLVHEVMLTSALTQIASGNAPALLDHLRRSHTTTEELGRVAAAAGVKTVVLSHLVPGGIPSISDEMWLEGVRRHFRGEIIVGRDMMEI
ncbi:MBL fold metallo-hydrolase [Sphingomonas panacisoli]|uniref:MBL fold metallo-hydrolase n=1 Tax=Sphingomonas panacisoli TaxID=1813879 RepID=A0A5B8LF83_9SPHN|nr:MBL fold metallo-hydrolase [Sphingomonas panacisoli]QDZ06405.1 MBL fold metallo-hydrolase [Sphingomonas panacisoli]